MWQKTQGPCDNQNSCLINLKYADAFDIDWYEKYLTDALC